ncbi:MAG TPA: GGDEF domain-containing protein [Chloroflexota bacterium]
MKDEDGKAVVPDWLGRLFWQPDEAFDALKRRVYLVVLPFGAFAALVAFVLRESAGIGDAFHRFLLPGLTLWFVALTVVQLRQKRPPPLLELASFLGIAGFFVARLCYFYILVGGDLVGARAELARFSSWIPVVFVIAYLVFEPRHGLVASLVVYLAMASVGLPSIGSNLAAGTRLDEVGALVQFYVSNAVFIALLFMLAQLKERYLKARVIADTMLRLAHTDFLTGVANRRQMEAWLEEEAERARRYNRELTIIMFDLDHFKAVNDHHGHDFGDYLLREIARLVQPRLRMSDRFGRWGGEEFLIIAPDTSIDQAQRLALRLKHAIESKPFKRVGVVTASFGVASLRTDGDSMRSLIQRVDEALYRAKTRGRNRVEVVA